MKKRVIVFLIVTVLLLPALFLFSSCKKDEHPTAQKTDSADATATPGAATSTASATQAPQEQDPEVDAHIIKFFDEDDIGSQITGMSYQCEFSWEENLGFCIYPLGEDPWVVLDVVTALEEDINLNDYPVFKMRVYNNTPSKQFEAFLMCSEVEGTDNNLVQYTIDPNKKEFVDYVINLKETQPKAFFTQNDGILTAIRFDAVNLDLYKTQIMDGAEDHKYYFGIDYIGFFKTVEDANNWNPAHVSK